MRDRYGKRCTLSSKEVASRLNGPSRRVCNLGRWKFRRIAGGSKPLVLMSMRQCGFWTSGHSEGTVCFAKDVENSVYEIDERKLKWEKRRKTL